MKILRIRDELHQQVKILAEKDRRTINAMAEILLETGMGKPFTGDSPRVSVNGGTPIQVEPGGVIKYEGKTPPTVVRVAETPKKIASEPSGSGVSVDDLIKQAPEYDPAVAERQNNGEQPCCQHPTRPCKHWVWDNQTGEGYKNTLSGRYREAD